MTLTTKGVTAKLRETWPDLRPIHVTVHADGVDIRMPAGPTTRGEQVQQHIADKLGEIDGQVYKLVRWHPYKYDGPRLFFEYAPVGVHGGRS